VSFWLYILRCRDGAYYTGHTDDLEKRVAQHVSGEIPGFTHERRPVQLVYSAEFQTREEALAVELQVKGWSRKKKEALIRGDWIALGQLAKGKHRHQRL
jgi:predicted GIY-YIG superfamily endonuclease